ncbi:MAG: flagellar biosynthesis anti-sigma factor FlgM [Acidobacteria bacterium]|nr:flagellar biosynthesis anti-sigma factor FlgM [Acidobacteriota bacterium]
MKVQNDNASISLPVTGDAATSKLTRKDRVGADTAATPSQEPDPITTSSVANQLETDPVRTARIERLREQVQNGTYSIPARELAGRLVDAHLSDFTKRS